MNVFVLCTGRCGSMTFIKACSFIRNFTASHESLSGELGARRFSYPARHIEADNRLSWLLGRLDDHYGASAFYVHLMRDRHETAVSFSKRMDKGIMRAYRSPGILMGLKGADPLDVALDYVDTVNANISLFLRDKPNRMVFRLEQAADDFATFCRAIDAAVDMPSALVEFQHRHNATDTASAVP